MNYPISAQQAEQAARDWAQNPVLNFSLEGIYLYQTDPNFPHSYFLKTTDDSQEFNVDCQTGEISYWKDVTAYNEYIDKLNENWPESSQMPLSELNALVRQFLLSKYQNFLSLNLQHANPAEPSSFYVQRLSNGVWYNANKASCCIDPWAGDIVYYHGIHSPAPTVSAIPTITQAQAEQTALGRCQTIQIHDNESEDMHALCYPRSGFILDNKGLWIANLDEQRLIWNIVVIVSASEGYTLEMYKQEVTEDDGFPNGVIYEVWVDAHTNQVIQADSGDIIKFEALPAPTFNPDGGNYQSAQNVAISTVIYGANIMYTLDNSEPTEQSLAYTEPIAINQTTTIKAKVFKTNWTASDTARAQYELQLPTPTFNPDGGTYQGTQNVAIACTISGATIRYTTDGNDPTESSAEYTAPVAISQSCTLKAKAFKTGWTASDLKSAAYTIE
jgi:hypothetical protein